MNGNIASFINFSKTKKGINQNSISTELEYKGYISEKSVPQATLNTDEKNIIRDEYISAIQYVLLNLTTPQERVFFKDLDLSNNNNLATVIPLVSQKLKEVAIYIAKERERAKFSTIKYNLKGSDYGTTIYVKNYVYTLYNDPDFTSLFLTFPPLSSINYLDASLNYYYAQNVDLYDKDYAVGLQDPGLYNGGDYEKLNLLYFNKDLYFPALSSNVIRQYTALNLKFLKTSNNKTIVVNSKQKLKVKYVSTNINDLEAKYFLYGEKTEANLIFNIIKNGVAGAQSALGSNKFLGNNLVYVADANTSNPLSGALVEAGQRYANILNYRNYTLQALESNFAIRKLNQIGGFFLPEKQGLSVALSKQYSFYYNTSLSGLNVTVDPALAINPRGNSKLQYPNVFYFTENASWIINDLAGQYNWGRIKDIKPYQKLNGYQSYEEVNFEYKSGINKVTDSFDFFTGPERNIWANSDVYSVTVGQPLPLNTREESYNTGVEDIYRWQGDIYGNNYALYKRLNNYDVPEQFNQQYSNTAALNLEDFQANVGLITASDEVAFLYRLSSFDTDVQSLSTTTIYNTIHEKYQKFGEVYVRTFNNTALKTLSDAFSAVFSKYSTAIQNEIRNSVKTFNIINDVIIIKTENYKVMERFVFHIDQDTFVPFYTFRTELQ
jgi:hypothetical protein